MKNILLKRIKPLKTWNGEISIEQTPDGKIQFQFDETPKTGLNQREILAFASQLFLLVSELGKLEPDDCFNSIPPLPLKPRFTEADKEIYLSWDPSFVP